MPYKNTAKQKKAQHESYKRNKARVRERNRLRRLERRAWFDGLIAGMSCETCGEADVACLDFHHKDPKTKVSEVSRMLTEFRSKDSIVTEMAKCAVICANCHRKLHYYAE